MREVTVTVPRRAVEDVLDRLLPIVPGGIREVPVGRRVELRMRGEGIPDREALVQAAGRWPHRVSERDMPDDWRQRRLLDYEQDVIGGRLVVRPDWAPAPSPGLIDLAIADSAAFGSGAHPTTRTCLELLLEIEPCGSFADLGCGSGVQAILAARLGWSPVVAVDLMADCVSAALANAERAGAQIEARVMDLAEQAPPAADGFAANVPAALHERLAITLPEPVPRVGVVSGFGGDEEEAAVIAAYARRGMRERQSRRVHGWSVLVLDRD
jgi:ribosomal protein L11 methyltransferase